jgi:hypothetical protein
MAAVLTGRVEVTQSPDATYTWRLLRFDGHELDHGGPFRRIEQAADDARATCGLTVTVTFRAQGAPA